MNDFLLFPSFKAVINTWRVLIPALFLSSSSLHFTDSWLERVTLFSHSSDAWMLSKGEQATIEWPQPSEASLRSQRHPPLHIPQRRKILILGGWALFLESLYMALLVDTSLSLRPLSSMCPILSLLGGLLTVGPSPVLSPGFCPWSENQFPASRVWTNQKRKKLISWAW